MSEMDPPQINDEVCLPRGFFRMVRPIIPDTIDLGPEYISEEDLEKYREGIVPGSPEDVDMSQSRSVESRKSDRPTSNTIHDHSDNPDDPSGPMDITENSESENGVNQSLEENVPSCTTYYCHPNDPDFPGGIIHYLEGYYRVSEPTLCNLHPCNTANQFMIMSEDVENENVEDEYIASLPPNKPSCTTIHFGPNDPKNPGVTLHILKGYYFYRPPEGGNIEYVKPCTCDVDTLSINEDDEEDDLDMHTETETDPSEGYYDEMKLKPGNSSSADDPYEGYYEEMKLREYDDDEEDDLDMHTETETDLSEGYYEEMKLKPGNSSSADDPYEGYYEEMKLREYDDENDKNMAPDSMEYLCQ